MHRQVRVASGDGPQDRTSGRTPANRPGAHGARPVMTATSCTGRCKRGCNHRPGCGRGGPAGLVLFWTPRQSRVEDLRSSPAPAARKPHLRCSCSRLETLRVSPAPALRPVASRTLRVLPLLPLASLSPVAQYPKSVPDTTGDYPHLPHPPGLRIGFLRR